MPQGCIPARFHARLRHGCPPRDFVKEQTGAMRPTLFHVFGTSIHAYPAMLALAFIAGTLLAVRDAERQQLWLPPEIGLWAFFGALIGAKAFHIIQYDTPWHVWKALLIWQGGLVFYGGLLGGMLAALLFTLSHKTPPILTADVIAPYLALGEAITRIGCFLNGCCYGAPAHAPWAVQFPTNSPAHLRQRFEGLIGPDAPLPLPVHPTQLYMIAGLAAAFIILKLVRRRQRFHGQVALLYAVLYGLIRFTVEIFRGDSARSVADMTVSQSISLALILIGVAIYGAAIWRGWGAIPCEAGCVTKEADGHS